MKHLRPAAVAGSFYPGEAAALEGNVAALLKAAGQPAETAIPKALIVPHAGYVYSGAVAACAYARLRAAASVITRVVLLGPAHRVALRGLALPDAGGFATPLGNVEIDADAARSVATLPQVTISADAHAGEHSLEVQLPFLQTILKKFKLLPLVVGDATPEEVAAVLERVWGGLETLLVISSDLSHYLPYQDARRIDDRTVHNILALSDAPLDHEQACGATPINGLVLAARRRGLNAQLLDLRNSGDTAGSRDRVVGYAAIAFHEDAAHDH
jgi:AmmeMemoRadiSam system protein B